MILDQYDYEKSTVFSTSGRFNTTTNVYGNTAYTTGTMSGPKITQLDEPQTDLIVRMFEKGEPGSENALNPIEIITTVGPKVGYEGPYLPKQ